MIEFYGVLYRKKNNSYRVISKSVYLYVCFIKIVWKCKALILNIQEHFCRICIKIHVGADLLTWDYEI